MNNTKWREVFQILIESRPGGLKWKFVDSAKEFGWNVPGENDICEDHIADGVWQPTRYREIDRVFIPAEYEVSRGEGLVPWLRTNDLDALESKLNSLGLLELERTDLGITLFAYSRK